MKKIILISCCALVVVIVVTAGPFTFRYSDNIAVSRSIYDVAPQFTDLRNWQHWHPDLINKDSSTFHFSANTTGVNANLRVDSNHQFTITAANPAGIVVKEEKNGAAYYESIWAEPDSMGRTARIYLAKDLRAPDWLKEKFFSTHPLHTGLLALQQNIQDPKRFYGFNIEITTVYDTLILTREITVPSGELRLRTKQLYSELDNYARQNNLIYRPYGYISYKPINSTEILLGVGIPVNRRINGINESKFLALPAQGRLLVGKYEGPYSGIKALYSAMGRYISDKNFKRAADPLEKYDVNAQTPFDSLHIKVEVDVPVY